MTALPASPYLARSELRAWCGRHHRLSIINWLKAEKIAYVPDADGWPKVARALHDRRLGLVDGPTPAQHSGPDFSSLDAA